MIDRAPLVERLAGARVGLIQAPTGYGKSTLIAQLAAALDLPTVHVQLRTATDLAGLVDAIRAAAQRSGLATLAAGLDGADPHTSLERLAAGDGLLLTIDDIQHADERATGWLAGLAGRPARLRIVLAGRRIDRSLAHAATDTARVDQDDLRLRRDEIEGLMRQTGAAADDQTLEGVASLTVGWPAAVALIARSLARGGSAALDRRQADAPEVLLRRFVRDLVESAGPEPARLLELVAGLPRLSAQVVDAIGGAHSFERLVDTGLPLVSRSDGWVELPDVIREAVRVTPLSAEQARAVATIYADRDEIVDAALVLHAVAEWDALCELLAGQPRDMLQRAGLGLLEAVVAAVPDDVLKRHIAALVQLVRAAERHDRLRSAWIERGLRLRAGRAIQIEHGLAAARAGDLDQARQLASAVISEAAGSETLTLGRAYLVRAYTLIVGDTAEATDRALDDLQAAAARFRLAGDRGWEADCHQAAGYGCHYTNGRYAAAIESLERSLALRSAPDAARSQALTFLAEVLVRADRLDEAEVALREARSIAQRLGDPRSIAYVAWTLADLHSARRDRPATLAALDDALAHADDISQSLAGIDLLVDAARMRMVVGDAEGALRDLEHAERLAQGTPRADLPRMSRARYEVLYGDPRRAIEELDRLDASAVAYRGDRWLRQLLRGAALRRADDYPGADGALAEARRLVAEAEDPARLERAEPELLTIARGAESRAESQLSIVLLGGFAVRGRGGRDVTPAAGRPQTLVKLLALRGSLAAEEAIDLLWPEADVETGRARLRNLLNRIRASSGPLVERRGEGLQLAADVIVDARRFEAAAAAALGAEPAQRAALARRALAWFTGELLPTDRYAEWADVPRERLRRRHLALLDLVADDAAAHGDLDESARLLDEAIAADPLEESRYARLARALLAQGRTRAASAAVERAKAAAQELGVVPGRDLRRLAAEIAAVEGRREV